MLRRYADDGGKDPLHPRRFPNSAARENSLHVHAKMNRVLDQLHAKTGLTVLRFQDFFLGTFLPFLRAFDRPIAIACLRLFTLPPLPPRPLFAFPFL